MIHKIRTSKFSKIIASYLAIQLMLTTVQPSNLFAQTSGPSQPEFNAFTPIGTSDMVNLSTGDFNYNIPIMDVGGYPLNLAYNAGITMDQEASWVGLGWNLNVGQINRQVRGIPDDFKGDEITYEKKLKDHVTVGINAALDAQVFGLEPDQSSGVNVIDGNNGVSLGLGVKYSNYHGISFTPSYGLSFDLSDQVSVGMDVQTSATEGVTISPRLNAKANLRNKEKFLITGGLNAGLSYNSNRGLTNYSFGASLARPTFGVYAIDKALNLVNSRIGGQLSFSDPIPLTPRKRSAFQDINTTFSFSFGVDLWGIDGEVELSANGSVQKLKDTYKKEKAYGYEFTGQASKEDVLDYNRENDRIINENITVLPTTNYTYDIYTVNGQGISGMFRPHRSQIGQIYDEFVEDESLGLSTGAELEGGPGSWHVGANLTVAPSKSHTGVWKTKATSIFTNENENTLNGDKIDYEPVYFKYVGENKVNQEHSMFTEQLHGDKPMALRIGGSKSDFGKYADNSFIVKTYEGASNKPIYPYPVKHISNTKIKRTKRDLRNQAIQKFTKKEISEIYNEEYANKRINEHAEDHHTAEVRVLKTDGATYVFGETAYNTTKHEVTFATNSDGDCESGMVEYNDPIKSNQKENTVENESGIDHFYDRVITPAYAHTYLLSAVLSSDYEDQTGNGPTDDDFGAYTLFEYEKNANEDFKWRIPFGNREASYNAGLNSDNTDQKASYIYGEKEIKYINKIITKTHIAVFDLLDRFDGIGTLGDDGGIGLGRQKRIDKIRLYSKPEYIKHETLLEDNDPTNDPVLPIKTAHFDYNYSLCQGLPNFDTVAASNAGIIEDGKLTLEKVYFSYRNSNMGKYTPYVFNYDGLNEPYSLKANDIWGNYKPNIGNCSPSSNTLTNPEFPFVNQDNTDNQDDYAGAWSLTSIDLPSGGTIQVEYESDDYQYVQDKHTMQMFQVVGVGHHSGDWSPPADPESNQLLYKINQDGSESGEATHLYVELPEETLELSTDDFKKKYLKEQEEKPIYFRFLLNMTPLGGNNNLTPTGDAFDYVTGYFNLNDNLHTFTAANSKIYAAIPMTSIKIGGGLDPNQKVNPISKAGWHFGRSYLNGVVNFGKPQDYRTDNIKTIAEKLAKNIGAFAEIFKGPNRKLRANNKLIARRFVAGKSWIRLSTPKTYKMGGGLRVKKIALSDKWQSMNTNGFDHDYGQTYEYTLEDDTTSGVATFEPNDSAENPFVEPVYDDTNINTLIAPREVNYVEKPFGKAFFPYSKITYSRVTVKNIKRANITRHATGKVVSEFYTTKDFPTKVDYTDLSINKQFKDNKNAVLENALKGLIGLKVNVKHEFALSQGFSVHTNDMDGKSKSQQVYQEGVDTPISSVEYKYSTNPDNDNILNNKLLVVDKNGSVSNQEIGVDYDVITDFRESYTNSKTTGLNVNVATLFFGIFPAIIPTSFPSRSEHENIAHSVITTKTIHTTAILKEKIAMDLGSTVSTVNEAWDAESGEIILTKTVNEFDDKYYNFNFPAYWAHQNMGQASKNMGLKGTLQFSGDKFTLNNADEYLTLGDEIIAYYGDTYKRLWVVDVDINDTVLLMDRDGSIVNSTSINTIQEDINFKVIRSGYRNQQMANMASITMMESPLKIDPADPTPNEVDYLKIDHNTFLLSDTTPLANNPRIINASAVAYDDFWNAQCENGLKSIPYANVGSDDVLEPNVESYGFNPYVSNVRGLWRAEKSYAYLTERTNVKNNTINKSNTRKEGYLKTFVPFYALESNNTAWELNPDLIDQTNPETIKHWTFASEVTQYSPYGAEIENKDALNRYSSAQYGYNFTLPTAVTSNSRYRYMGADNFEDYNYDVTTDGHFNYKAVADVDGDSGIEISTDYAHTGNTSLLVPQEAGGNYAGLDVELIGDEAPNKDADGDGVDDDYDNCPYTPNKDQYDYDGDDIGDVCDDEATPQLKNIETKYQIKSREAQAEFTIHGTPNTTVHYAIIEQSSNPNGWYAYVNGTFINRIINQKQQNFTIDLDATGRVLVQFQISSHKRNRGKADNSPAIIDFQLLHKKTLNNIEDQVVRIKAIGFRNDRKKEYVESIFPKL
ncbi:hypothetical protein BFR04_10545 [Gaetbulibacter sp. 4G1]|nr:thrombospondin type 3 repeat-containing protein [Gaetbulibacter sp. 4G1]PIA77208.1 hypothetical protein BFR04_10545 [Gaetbulibacter sp. 4G1]